MCVCVWCVLVSCILCVHAPTCSCTAVHVHVCHVCMFTTVACTLAYICMLARCRRVGVTEREITNNSSIEIYFCNARNLFLSLDDLPTTNITFLQPPSMELPVPPGPDNVVSAANLSCTVANEGSFQWQWTLPPGITLSQMWFADGNRTSMVQISQISAANAGDYTCRASFNVQSASTSIAVQLNRK